MDRMNTIRRIADMMERIRAEIAARLAAARDLIANRPTTPTPPAPEVGDNTNG